VGKFLVAFLCAASTLPAASPELDQAFKFYNHTDYEQSLKILRAIPHKDAAVYALIGRNLFMTGEYKKATDELEKSVAAEPRNAEFLLWLARSFGRRAEAGNPFTAPGYASHARQLLERSVQINPHDIEAVNDLFEYYLEAPGLLGGGVEKAEGLVKQISRINAAEGHWTLAKVAEHRKQYAVAEAEFRKAQEMEPKEAGRLVDLARFLTVHGRIPEADQHLAQADRVASNRPKLLYDKADLYVQSNRNFEMARDLLQKYMESSLTPDDPSRAEASKLLRKVQDHLRHGSHSQ
jgi:Flp pilus assembly protein TadD